MKMLVTSLLLGTSAISVCRAGDGRTDVAYVAWSADHVSIDLLPEGRGLAVTFFGYKGGDVGQLLPLEAGGSNLIAEGPPEDPILFSTGKRGSTLVGDFNGDGIADVAFLGEIEDPTLLEGKVTLDILTTPAFAGDPAFQYVTVPAHQSGEYQLQIRLQQRDE